MAQSAAIKRLLSRVQVRHLIPYSDSQIYRLEQQDRFPRRLRIGPNRVAWLEDEISNWLQQRIDDRRKTQPVHNSQQFATMNRRENPTPFGSSARGLVEKDLYDDYSRKPRKSQA